MLTALIFGGTKPLTEYVNQVCAEFDDICVYKSLDSYPAPYDAVRMLNSYSPEVVFVQLAVSEHDHTSTERIKQLVDQIRMVVPETGLVGILPKADEEGLRTAAELGIMQILIPPFRGDQFRAAVFRALRSNTSVMKCNVFSFMPAKAGVGSTVTALNVASCLSRVFKKKVLVIEADMVSGPIGIMLHLQSEHSITDALDSSDRLNDAIWSQTVSTVGEVELLITTGGRSPTKTSQFSFFRLLSFAQQRYDTIIVDLPEAVDEAAEPLLAHSRGIYIVCTPELTALALARRRLHALEVRGISDSCVHIVLNRYNQTDWKTEHIEEMIGRKLSGQLPNDYREVQTAIQSGGFVNPASDLGNSFVELAAKLAGVDAPPRLPSASPDHQTSGLKSFLKKLSHSNT